MTPEFRERPTPESQQVASEGLTPKSAQVVSERLPPESQQIAIEEIKLVAEERRFVMNRYMQAFALYLALAGYGLKELVETHGLFENPPFAIAFFGRVVHGP